MNRNFPYSSSPDPDKRGKPNLWQRLVEPPAVITDVAERRQATLVSTLLLALIPWVVVIGPVATTYILHDPTSAFILVTMGLWVHSGVYLQPYQELPIGRTPPAGFDSPLAYSEYRLREELQLRAPPLYICF